jgi:hypothetical protein
MTLCKEYVMKFILVLVGMLVGSFVLAHMLPPVNCTILFGQCYEIKALAK